MDRRDFLGTGMAAGAGILAAGSAAMAQAPAGGAGAPATVADAVKPADPNKKKFKLKYAPQFNHFEAHAGKDPIELLRFMADQGFSALLDGGFLKKPVELQDKIVKEMDKLGMTLGGPYCSSGSMVASTDKREEFAKTYKGICEQLKRINAKWFLVVPGGLVKDMPMEQQTANVIENLKWIMKEVEPSGCILTLEPLNPRDHKGLFLTKIPQAVEICKAVGSPSCKIVNDIYHQQITEGDLIPNIKNGWDYIAHYHLGDTPGRKEPTTGEINYRSIFKFLYEKGFQGVLGMEHGKSKGGKEGEIALLNAYRWCDAFDEPYKI